MRDPFTVDFSLAEEFAAELQTHDAISWDTVRLSLVRRRSRDIPTWDSVTVVATAVVAAGGVLLRLRQYVGEFTGLQSDLAVSERAKAAMTLVEQTAVRRGLRVRAGVYSLANSEPY